MSKGAKGAPSKEGAPARSKAARAEKKDEQPVRTVEFEGTTFTLVAEAMPATLGADLVTSEMNPFDPRPLWRIIMGFLGPEQFNVVRNHVATKGAEAVAEEVSALVADCMATFGTSAGESDASR